MKIDKLIEIEMLFSQYSMLLTLKQRDIVSMYYNEDYSLGEISELLNISRQSVYDSLKRSEKSLKEYEKKLGIVKKNNILENKIGKIEKIISFNDKKIKDIDMKELKILIEEIRELI